MKKFNYRRITAIILVLALLSVNEFSFIASANTLPAEQSEDVQDSPAADLQQTVENPETAVPEENQAVEKENQAIGKENQAAEKEEQAASKENVPEQQENQPALKEDKSEQEENPASDLQEGKGKEEETAGTYTITINYIFKDDKTMAARPYMESVPAGDAVSKSVTSPEVLGYQPLTPVENIDIASMDKDMTYDVYYVPKTNTPYTVNHYQENIDRDGYTLTGVGHMSGRTNEIVTASPQPYTGFTPPDVMPSAQISPDGSTTLDVYYTRDQYTMYFDTGEGGNYIEPITAAFDQALTPPPDPVRPGYRFEGWGSYGFPSRMPIGDILMKAEWSVEGEVSHTFVYWLESIEGNGTYDYVGAFQDQAPAESVPVIPENPPSSIKFPIDKAHFQLNEEKTNAKKPDQINGTGSTIVNVYYDRKPYSVSFNFDDTKYTLKVGDTVYDKSPYVLTAKFGANIADKWPAEAPELRPGQSGDGGFTGWITQETDLYFSTIQYFLEDLLVRKNSLNARWSYKTKNVGVTYLFEDLTGGGETSKYEQFINIHPQSTRWNVKQFIGFTPTEEVVNITQENTATFHYKRNSYQITFYNSGIIDKTVSGIKYEAPILEQNYTPPTPAALPGYTFGGWYTSPETYDGSEYDFTGKTMPAKNLILHAKWVKPTYTVTFHPNNGADDFTQRVILHGNAAEPDTPTRPGYRFAGWYKTGSSFRYIFPPVTGDTTLNARWIPVDDVGYDVIYKIGTPEDSVEHSRTSYRGKTVGTKVTAFAIAIPGMLPDAAKKTITLAADGNHIVFYYAPFTNAEYTVKYLESNTHRQLLPDKKVVTSASEATENYVHISGYYPDRYQQTLLISPVEEENVLVFTYTKNADAAYKVEHYLEQPDGRYQHETSSTETFTAPIGSVQTAAPKTFSNYHYNAGISHPKDVVLPDDATVLRMYYSLSRYTVKYLAEANGSLQGEAVFRNIRHGSLYETAAPAPLPKPAPGYKFTGWDISLPAPGTAVTVDATYTAKFAVDPTQWATVSYHPNGGTGTMAGDTVLIGSEYTILPNVFSRANHQFIGWNSTENADGTAFAEEERITVTGDITLYAEWVPDTQYAVTYIANGGTGHMSDPNASYYKNDSVTVLPNAYTRAGYRFTKWTTNQDGTGTSYDPADTFKITENTVLYAQWAKDPSQWVTIQFDKNDAKATGNMESREVLADEPFTIPVNGYKLENYDFHGWSSQKEGNGTDFADEAVFTPGVKFPSQRTIVLHAQWKEHEKYTVTYHSNNPLNQTVTDTAFYYKGSTVRLHPSSTFSYPYHTFMYWSESLDTDTTYMAGESFTIDRNMELYANWEKNPVFHVAYKDPYSGDTYHDPKTYHIEPEGSESVTVKDSMFLRRGYNFAGWDVEFKDTPGVRHAAQPGNVLKEVTSDTTLYARWEPHVYKITYDLYGGQVYDVNPSEYDIETPTFTLINPERPGYTFVGWSGTDINPLLPSDNVTVLKGSIGDRQYTAHWKKDPEQWSKIIFETADPSMGKLSGTKTFEGIKGTSADHIIKPGINPAAGYMFSEWDRKIPTTYPDTDVTVYAHWKKDPEQWSKIIFKSADLSKGRLSGTQIFEGIKGEATSDVSEPEGEPLSGFRFAQWDKAIPETFPDSDVTIYASWESVPSESIPKPPSESVPKPPSESVLKPPFKSVPKAQPPSKSTPVRSFSPGTTSTSSKSRPKTGDSENVFLWIGLAAASGVMILVIKGKRKKID